MKYVLILIEISYEKYVILYSLDIYKLFCYMKKFRIFKEFIKYFLYSFNIWMGCKYLEWEIMFV